MAPDDKPRGPFEPPPKKAPCSFCGSTGTEIHCLSATCTWIKCTQCHRLTDTRRLTGSGGT